MLASYPHVNCALSPFHCGVVWSDGMNDEKQHGLPVAIADLRYRAGDG